MKKRKSLRYIVKPSTDDLDVLYPWRPKVFNRPDFTPSFVDADVPPAAIPISWREVQGFAG